MDHSKCCKYVMVDGKRYTLDEVRDSPDDFDYADSMVVRCDRPFKVDDDDNLYCYSQFKFTFRCCLDPECSEYDSCAIETLSIVTVMPTSVTCDGLNHGSMTVMPTTIDDCNHDSNGSIDAYISLGNKKYEPYINGLLNFDSETYLKIISDMRVLRSNCQQHE